jgi:hypothetical protein
LFINTAALYEDYALVKFESPYTNFSVEDLGNLRPCETVTFEGNGLQASFSLRANDKFQSQLGLGAYMWYFCLVFAIVYYVKLNIEEEVVIPFNSLKEKIWSLIMDPMIVVS